MYKNKNTGEIWKISYIETERYFPDGVNKAYKNIYVFENGERWCAEEFFTHWVKVE